MSKHKHILLTELKEHFNGKPIIGAEVGVYRGDTSEFLLANYPDLQLYLIDSWDGDYNTSDTIKKRIDSGKETWQGLYEQVVNRISTYRATIMRGNSQVLSNAIMDSSLDFVFIDADHTYKATLDDCRAYWPKIKSGGLLFGHDHLNAKHHGCTEAYRQFEQIIGQSGRECGEWVIRFDK